MYNLPKFSHIGDRCSTKAYWFCAAVRLFKDHAYSICNIIGKPYKYTTPLYSNYIEKHFTNSKDCESLKAAKLVY